MSIDYKRLEFLEKCVNLSNDSWGEMVSGLLRAKYSSHGMYSLEFEKPLEEELLGQLESAEQNCKIITKTETREITYEELLLNMEEDYD